MFFAPNLGVETGLPGLAVPSALADPGGGVGTDNFTFGKIATRKTTGGFLNSLRKAIGQKATPVGSFQQASFDPNLKNIGVVALAAYAQGTTPSLGRRNLTVSDDVYEDERVETGIDGSLHVKFADKTDFFPWA